MAHHLPAADVGRQAADFILTGDSLDAASRTRAIGSPVRTNHLVKQNIAIAIAYNCIAVPLALAGFVTPLIAAIAMSGSSIVVVANSLRLRVGGGRLSDSAAPDLRMQGNGVCDMSQVGVLIPIALFLGLLGLGAFVWSLRNGQYEDLEGAAHRILDDEDDRPL